MNVNFGSLPFAYPIPGTDAIEDCKEVGTNRIVYRGIALGNTFFVAGGRGEYRFWLQQRRILEATAPEIKR
jgi:hypothetical protein